MKLEDLWTTNVYIFFRNLENGRKKQYHKKNGGKKLKKDKNPEKLILTERKKIIYTDKGIQKIKLTLISGFFSVEGEQIS